MRSSASKNGGNESGLSNIAQHMATKGKGGPVDIQNFHRRGAGLSASSHSPSEADYRQQELHGRCVQLMTQHREIDDNKQCQLDLKNVVLLNLCIYCIYLSPVSEKIVDDFETVPKPLPVLTPCTIHGQKCGRREHYNFSPLPNCSCDFFLHVG